MPERLMAEPLDGPRADRDRGWRAQQPTLCGAILGALVGELQVQLFLPH